MKLCRHFPDANFSHIMINLNLDELGGRGTEQQRQEKRRPKNRPDCQSSAKTYTNMSRQQSKLIACPTSRYIGACQIRKGNFN